MGPQNVSTVTEFQLLGFQSLPEWQTLLFAIFLFIYFLTVMRNVVIIAVKMPDRECSSDTNAQQGRELAGSGGEPPALEEGSRAKTLEELGTLDSGFRCLGYCRVFCSFEVLQAHVENAVHEGFSCHIFKCAFAQMLSKYKKRT
ncbi:Protein FAM170A [Manis javanica]|nr:Protein FAM170A [Manis javanica]